MQTIKWRQDYEQLPIADINTVPVKLDKPIWHEFTDGGDVELLLAGKVPIIVKLADGTYKTNNADVQRQYLSLKKRCILVGTGAEVRD